jgi:hypothetical protein
MKITKDIRTFIKKFPTNFVAFLTKNLGKNGFSSVNLINFANFFGNFLPKFQSHKIENKEPYIDLMNMSNSYVCLTHNLD